MEKVKKSNQRKMERKRHIKGITLIALIITIIVLLILAGVTIGAITGQNGTIIQANDAKVQTEIAQEKETLEIATVKAMGKDKEGNVIKKYLDQELDESVGVNKYASDDQTTELGIIVTYIDSGRNYLVDTNGKVSYYDKNGDTEEPEEPDVPENTLEIGDYVKYDVPYTDTYTDYQFTEQNGWRVLDPGTENTDGTYSGVKLISTGVPANLNYYSKEIKNKETDGKTPGKWAGEAKQRQDYKDKFNLPNSRSDNNMYAAAGLYYNFELINFLQGSNSERNEGTYKQILGNIEGEITGKEFRVEEMTQSVHNLTLEEINEARGKKATDTSNVHSYDGATGLFYLRNLSEYGYDTSKNPYYWLTSPYNSNIYSLWSVSSGGEIITNDSGRFGVRPVVSIKSNVSIEKIEK